MAHVTRHAAKRTTQRLGLPKRVTEKNAEKALKEGLQHKDTRGGLRRYLDALYLKKETANNIRIYNNNVYIFNGETLITVFPLPQKYRKTVERIKKGGRRNEEDAE